MHTEKRASTNTPTFVLYLQEITISNSSSVSQCVCVCVEQSVQYITVQLFLVREVNCAV